METKEWDGPGVAASRVTAAPTSTATRTAPRRSQLLQSPRARDHARFAAVASTMSRRSQVRHFVWHYVEMCAPMCIGFAVGDLVYFRAAGRFGYSEPFSELPEVSVLVVTFTMTAPMVAWMLFRGMPRRVTAEMAAVMPILAIALLALGWLALVPESDLALLEHGLMVPAMLVPMFFRLDLYTGAGHAGRHTARLSGIGRVIDSERLANGCRKDT
jgi:hypothetical protein